MEQQINGKNLFSRVSGKVFATSMEEHVFRNLYYTLELRENINKPIHPKKACTNIRVLMISVSKQVNSIKTELGNRNTLLYFWFCTLFMQHDFKFFIRDLLCAQKVHWWEKKVCFLLWTPFFLRDCKFSINVSCLLLLLLSFPRQEGWDLVIPCSQLWVPLLEVSNT